uniref:ATP synthase F(1) complex subunit delta, mitochondrial n=1 Tax=Ciona savignyi TaxID=51511 RepID=H2ZM24_CIOSA
NTPKSSVNRPNSDKIIKQAQRNYAEAAAAVAQPGQMAFTFACPSEVFYDSSTAVKQVDVSTSTGSIGILANHVPTLGVLQPGVISVYEAEGPVKKFFVSSGSYCVNEDASVQINAEEAVPVEQLDKELARANLSKAQSEFSSAATEVAKVEAQIAIECNEAIINAV